MSDTHENSTPISLIAEEFSVSNKKLLHLLAFFLVVKKYTDRGGRVAVDRGVQTDIVTISLSLPVGVPFDHAGRPCR